MQLLVEVQVTGAQRSHRGMQERLSLQSLARGRVMYQELAFFHIGSWFQYLVVVQEGLTRSSVVAPFV